MKTKLQVTIINHNIKFPSQEFICSNVDISDLDEVDYCAQECIGRFVELYEEALGHSLTEREAEAIAAGCSYFIEEDIDYYD
jgi:hypothetical protein